MSLAVAYKKLNDGVADAERKLLAIAATTELDKIRYLAGILDGLKMARQAVQDEIAKGGE